MIDGTHSLVVMLSKAMKDDVSICRVPSGLMIEFMVRGYRFYLPLDFNYLLCESRNIVSALEIYDTGDVVWC